MAFVPAVFLPAFFAAERLAALAFLLRTAALAFAAFRARSLRSAAVMLSAAAFPPMEPFSFPNCRKYSLISGGTCLLGTRPV